MAYTTINKSTDHFNTKLYTGSGSAPNAQTGVGFKPDFLWIKTRSTGNDNRIHSPLLTGSDYFLHANATNAETQNTNCVTSFDTDGFTLGNTDAGWNGSGVTYASWNWKANGAGSANTDGSINTTATSVNTTAGISICKWTGSGANATIGHGLGVAPKMIMVKNTSATNDWNVYHHGIGNTERLFLNTTQGSEDNASAWNDTSPTSSVFSIGTNTNVNQSGSTMIAYVFAEKTGFSKFGKYYGNSDANGAFVYTGFKPAFVLWKVTSGAANDWTLLDNKRDSFNVAGKRLYPNTSGAESETARADFLSNGFKLRADGSDMNGSGNTYIYMAFAEAPLVGSNNVPATAR